MSKVLFTEPAEYDLIEIENYIALQLCNPQAAVHVVDGIIRQAEGLSDFPLKHPCVNDPLLKALDFRMTWFDHYNIFYIYDALTDTVHIIRILYHKKNWQFILRRFVKE